MPKPSVLRSQQRYWERKRQGICVYSACNLPSFEGRVYCETHWKERRAFEKVRWQRDKEKRNLLHLKWTKEQRSKLAASQKKYRDKVRKEVIERYGGACVCCGQKEFVFLDMDHINNDGAKHRKETGYIGLSFYLWIKRAGYPKEFQVLCKNCNWAKFVLGKCPHECIESSEACSA